jgi:hypothetical protein
MKPEFLHLTGPSSAPGVREVRAGILLAGEGQDAANVYLGCVRRKAGEVVNRWAE